MMTTPTATLPGFESDPLLPKARAIVVAHKRASVSLVQRTLLIGYNRAARMMEELEKLGVVSPWITDDHGNFNRTVLVTE